MSKSLIWTQAPQLERVITQGKIEYVSTRFEGPPPDVSALCSIKMRVTESITVRILGADEGAVLAEVAPDVFDHPLNPRWSAEFLADARHHLAVALHGERVVGMASAVHYVHPDKVPELWINEVGVAPSHQGSGIGKKLLNALLAKGRDLGCTEAWVLTEEENMVARRLYRSMGGNEEPQRPVYFTFKLAESEEN